MSEFRLNFDESSGSQGFADRCKDIFGSLADQAANRDKPCNTQKYLRKLEAEESGRTSHRPSQRSRHSDSEKTSDFRGRESIFRVSNVEGFTKPHKFQRPRPPRRVPDHVLNPEKYTKYSLKDVDEVSDRSNARAAFDFLSEQRERRQIKDKNDQGSIESGKITFKKPIKSHKTEIDEPPVGESVTAVSGSSKRIMPECQVGVVQRSSVRRNPVKVSVEDEDQPEDDLGDGEPNRKRKRATPEKESKPKKKISKLSFDFDDE